MKKLASKAKQLNLRAKARVQERKEKLRRELELRRLKRIRRKNNIPPYRYCKNCGTELKGMYCHECGQYAMDSRQPFWKYFLQYFEMYISSIRKSEVHCGCFSGGRAF